MSVPSASENGGITWGDCYPAGTGESGYIAVHPRDPNLVYVGAVGSSPGGGGALQRYDHRTRQIRLVTVWPEVYYGWGAKDLRYRFAWTFPIVFSPHDPGTLYATGNLVFRTRDEGSSWEAISPDLTRQDPTKLEASGGPLTKDTSGAEHYGTVYAFAESPSGARRPLGGQRRRADPRLPRRRADVAERDAARSPRMVADRDDRAVAPRPGHGLRRGHALQDRRLPPVSLQDRGLRPDVAGARRGVPGRRDQPGDPRGPRPAGAALRRNGNRHRGLEGRRRVRGTAAAPGTCRSRPSTTSRSRAATSWRRPTGGRSGSWTTSRLCESRWRKPAALPHLFPPRPTVRPWQNWSVDLFRGPARLTRTT